jgi:hypothetical protein
VQHSYILKKPLSESRVNRRKWFEIQAIGDVPQQIINKEHKQGGKKLIEVLHKNAAFHRCSSSYT